MAIERTFSIIKPDATKRNLTGKIIDRFESNGLRIIAAKRIHMTREQAGGFYAVHKQRPFYNDLVDFMAGRLLDLLGVEHQLPIRWDEHLAEQRQATVNRHSTPR